MVRGVRPSVGPHLSCTGRVGAQKTSREMDDVVVCRDTLDSSVQRNARS